MLCAVAQVRTNARMRSAACRPLRLSAVPGSTRSATCSPRLVVRNVVPDFALGVDDILLVAIQFPEHRLPASLYESSRCIHLFVQDAHNAYFRFERLIKHRMVSAV
jgi:hypothetical protein